jgi:hypothetical protein
MNMSKENVQWLVIGLLIAGIVGLGAIIINQKSQLSEISRALVGAKQTNQQAPAPALTEQQPNTISQGEVPQQAQKTEGMLATSSCPRAHVKEDNKLNADGSIKETLYTVSVNGELISGSTISDTRGRIGSALVSSDCSRVSWTVIPRDETSAEGKYVKAELIRTVLIGKDNIQDFSLPIAGPASITPYIADRILVGIGQPVVSEADIPSEGSFALTFYSVEVTGAVVNKVGGPYLAVSPDLQKIVKTTDQYKVVLSNLLTNKTVVLANGAKEYATDFTFSPDSNNLAYLKLSGDRSLIFAELYRPIDVHDILSGSLLIQPVDGGAPKDVIRGGFTPDNEFRVDRWISPTILQYTQPETSVRVQQVDYSTTPPTFEKKELIDWDAI